MPRRDPRIDDYIAAAAPFARPLLMRLREDLHAASPGLDEAIRWGRPAFLHEGKLIAVFAAFTGHASLGFWRGEEVIGKRVAGAMGQFGRLRSLDDLPDRESIASLVARAIAVAESGRAPPDARHTPRPEPMVPEGLLQALQATPAARRTFDAFPPGQRREYVEWIEGAKREETRRRRVAQAIEWLLEGKPRNWKHMPHRGWVPPATGR